MQTVNWVYYSSRIPQHRIPMSIIILVLWWLLTRFDLFTPFLLPKMSLRPVTIVSATNNLRMRVQNSPALKFQISFRSSMTKFNRLRKPFRYEWRGTPSLHSLGVNRGHSSSVSTCTFNVKAQLHRSMVGTRIEVESV